MALEILSDKEIRAIAPAAFAKEPDVSRSNRYSLVNTMDAVNALRETGLEVTQASQSGARKRNIGKHIHMLVMNHRAAIESPDVKKDVIPSILMINSHNGRTKFRMFAGFYRFVCANGMVVGEDVASIALSHAGASVESQVQDAMEKITEQTLKAADQIERWKRTKLTDGKIIDFADAAKKLRFGESAGAYDSNVLLKIDRPEDKGNDLWRVFNRVQEKLVNGGVEGMNANNHAVRSRALTAVSPAVDFNRGLWRLADDFALKLAA